MAVVVDTILKKNFSRFLAFRYLKPKRTSVSIITLLCVTGVALGVWIMLVVLSVMQGFEKRTKELLLGFEYHVFIEQKPSAASPAYPLSGWRGLLDQLKATPGVKAASPIVEGMVLADANGMRSGQRMRGITEDDDHVRAEIELTEGSFDGADPSVQPMVVSDLMLEGLGLSLGDTVDVYSQAHFDKVLAALEDVENPAMGAKYGEQLKKVVNDLKATSEAVESDDGRKLSIPRETVNSALGSLSGILEAERHQATERMQVRQAMNFLSRNGALGEDDRVTYFAEDLNFNLVPLLDIAERPVESEEQKEAASDRLRELVLPKQLTVTGTFKQPPHVNAPTMLMPLYLAQELYSFSDDDVVHSLGVRIEDAYEADEFAKQLQAQLPEGFAASSWITRNRDVFFALANERRMMYFALACVMVVASFCIMVTMITVTVEKRQEMGVMKALGATVSQIVAVFAVQGILVGLVGALSGLSLALLTLRFRDQVQSALGYVGMDPFPRHVYGLERIPAHVEPMSLLWIGLGAFILSTLASLPPAWSVARLDPAKALRTGGN